MKADKNKVVPLLKTAKGQLEGIIKMVEEDRYCCDISNQLLATSSIILKVNQTVLRAHIENCLKDAILEDNLDQKLDEVMKLISKVNK